MNKIKMLCLMTFVVLLTTGSINARAQAPAGKREQQPRPDAAVTPVAGSGTSGQISKWIGFNGSSFVIGDSNITEDKFGSIGIGTTAPTSVLTVKGMIETTLGGYKFPDGTVQTTAGISFVTHDASLAGLGDAASPLGIAPGGVNTIHLANGVVTAAKIANGTVVRSFNGLFDNVSLTAGSNITITPAGNTLTIASPNSLTSVSHDSTLTGAGTSVSPLGIADGAIGTPKLATGAVTSEKISPGQVVKGLNGLTDNITLVGGRNITITQSAGTVSIAANGAEEPGRSPYQETIQFGFGFGACGQNNCELLFSSVPAGKRLVIKSISATFVVDRGLLAAVALAPSGNSVSVFVPTMLQGNFGKDFIVTNLQLQAYCDPGSAPIAFVLLTGNTTNLNGAQQVTVTGYYVDVP